jgi:hypothetical protein
MEFAGYLAALGGALIGGIGLLFLVVVTVRSRKIPECYSCGAMKVRPSRAEGFWDTFATAFIIRPYRCGGCRERYYGFRNSYDNWKKAQTEQPRLIKVAFRLSHGLPNRVAIRVVDPSRKADPISPDPADLEPTGFSARL